MNKTRLILLFLAVPLSLRAQTDEELIKARVDAGETPGIAVAIYREGKSTYYAFGYADVAGKRAPDSKTLFEIGSITKTFTSIVAAQLAQEGKLSLTDPAQKYFPEGSTLPTRGDKVITIEDLASARSGLPRMPHNFMPADNANPYIDYTAANLFDFLKGYQLTRDIGTQYEYSNLGMGLLGVLVSRIDGKPYREAVTTRILKPLKMNSTFLNTPGRADKNSAIGYSDDKPVKAWTWSDESAMQGAGGLLSNTEDMMKYLLANMNPPDNSLGRAMKDAHQPRMDAGRNNVKIGLGWHIRNKIIWHNGGTGGFRTFAGFEPEKKMAVVVLTNSGMGADDLGFHMMDESIPLKAIRKIVSVPDAALQSYVGVYELTAEFSIAVMLEGGQLVAQATGQGKANLYAESEMKFFYRIVDAQVEFVKNSEGAIDKLLLYQGGQIRAGIRKP
jgi:CubicO group peptidase (beta-lactamase class C family)